MTELQFFNLLPPEDREIMRKYFISTGSNSSFYSNLEDAIRGSVNWEDVKSETPEFFYLYNLLDEVGELKKKEKTC